MLGRLRMHFKHEGLHWELTCSSMVSKPSIEMHTRFLLGVSDFIDMELTPNREWVFWECCFQLTSTRWYCGSAANLDNARRGWQH